MSYYEIINTLFWALLGPFLVIIIVLIRSLFRKNKELKILKKELKELKEFKEFSPPKK